MPNHNKYKLIDMNGNPDVYINNKTKICFYHVTCGRYFSCTPGNFIKKPKLYNVSTYCPLCNHEHVLAMARTHINYAKISNSNKKRKLPKSLLLSKQWKRFLNRFHNLPNSNDYILKAPRGKHEIFKGWHHEFWFYHKKCKTYSHMIISNFFRKVKHGRYGCSYCSRKVARREDFTMGRRKHLRNCRRYEPTFLKRVYSQPDNCKNHIYVPLWHYQGMRTKLPWLVWTKHPHIMWMTPNEFLNSGKRDPSEHRYIGEDCVMDYLNYYGFQRNLDYFHGYVFHNNKKKTKCLHCDIFIPGLSVGSKYNSVGIEYDGSQHFQPVDFERSFQSILNHHQFIKAGKIYMKLYNILLHNRQRDKDKENYCTKHHIYLIRIEHYRLNNQNYRYVKNLVTKTLNKKLLPIILHDIYE